MDEQIRENSEIETEEVKTLEQPVISPRDILRNQQYKQFAAIGIICAIVGYILSCTCPIMGIVIGITGLVFGILAKDAKGKKHMVAIMAIIISIVAILTGAASIVTNLITILFDDSFMEMYNEMLNEMQNSMYGPSDGATGNLY